MIVFLCKLIDLIMISEIMILEKNLHKEFVKTAFDINKMKNKLMSLLLEIYEKEIYKKYNCGSIFEYGFKYARLSKNVVEKGIRTLRNLENKPCLKKMIETQGIHKVALVATLADEKTDKIFAEYVGNMSKPALAELAKEVRAKRDSAFFDDAKARVLRRDQVDEFGDGSFDAKINFNMKGCQAVNKKIKIELDEETEILFLRLKKKYAKESSNKYALKVLLKKMADVVERKGGELMADFVEGEGGELKADVVERKGGELMADFVEGEGGELKADVVEGKGGELKKMADVVEGKGNDAAKRKCYEGAVGKGDEVKKEKADDAREKKGAKRKHPLSSGKNSTRNYSRYIKSFQKQELLRNHNHTCVYPKCNKPYEVIHHRTAFSFDRRHENVIPLCKTHHEFAHNGLIAHELELPKNWRLNINGPKTLYDYFYLGKM
jgi:hypothetical protein